MSNLEQTAQGSNKSAGLLRRLFRNADEEPLTGLYLYGSVGTGKTMLMDLFFEFAPIDKKRRVHFHEFMADVHDKIAKARKRQKTDPIPIVAQQIRDATTLLCFDELHVMDIADAMILGRLFQQLFDCGLVAVATSNAAPHELYPNGLNRQLFLPFVSLIEKHMTVHHLSGRKDYRLDKLRGRERYFTPADEKARHSLDEHWERLTGHHPAEELTLEILGRQLKVPMASMGVARFDFTDLCAKPLGARDYLHIAHAFHTVLIDNIPVLTPENRNEARRFINLIDTFYDNHVSLIASADAEPDGLYRIGDGADLFARTASRLIEMRSEEYLEKREQRTRANLEP